MTRDSTVSQDTAWLIRCIEAFTEDELEIIKALVHRMGLGRETYGPWRIDDGRNYPWEALLEVYDALQYCAAELVRLARVDRTLADLKHQSTTENKKEKPNEHTNEDNK